MAPFWRGADAAVLIALQWGGEICSRQEWVDAVSVKPSEQQVFSRYKLLLRNTNNKRNGDGSYLELG